MARKRNKVHRNVVTNLPLVGDTAEQNSDYFLMKRDRGDYSKPDSTRTCGGKYAPKFRNDFMRQVYYLAKLGARDCDIAEFFGVDASTVDDWKVRNQDFLEAMQEGKWLFGFRVSETLGNRALGYDYEEVEYSQHVDRFGIVRDLVKTTKKHMAPDVTAIIFFLKNRHRELWADVNKTEVDAKYQVEFAKTLNLKVFTEDELKMMKGIVVKSISLEHGVSGN
jgi:hypothetical protein